MKLRILDKVYILLIIALMIMAIVSFVEKTTIDIHIHDTKFVIAHADIVLVLIFYTVFLGLSNYWISSYKNKTLVFQWIIFILTILSYFKMLYLVKLNTSDELINGHYLNLSHWHNFNNFKEMNKSIIIVSLITIGIQTIFWGYFIFLVVRKSFLTGKSI